MQFKSVVSLIADPVRAVMLWNLLGGKALTATELAIRADVSAQNASMHLKRLIDSGILNVCHQGRHRYYKIERPEVAYAIEALGSLAQMEELSRSSLATTDTDGVRYCRTCYDHLAGKVGVQITEHLVKSGLLTVNGNSYSVTAAGNEWFSGFNIDTELIRKERRSFARLCLDWSERRHHLAGALGAALLAELLSRGWIRPSKNSRAALVTEKGRNGLYEELRLIL